MSILDKLARWFERKPLVLLKFDDGFRQALRESKRGLGRFTVTKPHGVFEGVKAPTLCLAQMSEGTARRFYVGIITFKARVATFESRLTLIKLQPLDFSSFDSIAQKFAGPQFAVALTADHGSEIINALSTNATNKKTIEVAASSLPGVRTISVVQWEQFDAIKTAMGAFGLNKGEIPVLLDMDEGSDSTLNYLEGNALDEGVGGEEETLDSIESHVLEDNVIATDASVIPGFSLIKRHVTGRAVFQRSDEQLVVYTANKGPLEKMLGVDLIYINESLGNTVMVQYKMLEKDVNPVTVEQDWIFRPDEQLKIEMARMGLPAIKRTPEDYRLHRDPFFFKFVRRKGDGESHKSFVISLAHLNQLLTSPKSRGRRDGVRVSYASLDGVYLRETDLIGLIRSGYVGTHRVETDALKPIIAEVANGNRALVLAWQGAVKMKNGERRA